MANSPSTTHRLLALIAVVAVGAALEATASVMLPIVFGLFLTAVLWPVYRPIAARATPGMAALASVVVFIAAAAAVAGGLYYGGRELMEQLDTAALEETLKGLSGRLGVVASVVPDPEALHASLEAWAEKAASMSTRGLSTFVLATAFLGLGIVEVEQYRRRLEHHAPSHKIEDWVDVARRVARDFQRYVVVRTGVGLMTGVAVTVGSLAVGLELALVWGLTNFLLNYIPTIGSIIGAVLPVLYALVQFKGDPVMVLAVVGVVGGIQLVMGNWIDPLIQGKALSLSPFVVLASVTFWGFIWGVGGALLAVPITVFVTLLCREFPSTKWVAWMLAAPDSEVQRKDEEENAVPTPAE